jgi:hypothetical protein
MKKPVTATSIRETETNGGIVEQVPEPAWLFYVLSFIVPIAGIIIGVIYLAKPDEELKRFGKTCLIFAAIPIALYLLYILSVIIMFAICVLFVFIVFLFYIFVFLLLIIAAFISTISPGTPAAGAVLFLTIL